jgi:hypothetical protein
MNLKDVMFSRDIWCYFRTKRNCIDPDVHLEDFKLHFESIFSDVNHIPHTESEEFNVSHNFDDLIKYINFHFDCLDRNITFEEVFVVLFNTSYLIQVSTPLYFRKLGPKV